MTIPNGQLPTPKGVDGSIGMKVVTISAPSKLGVGSWKLGVDGLGC